MDNRKRFWAALGIASLMVSCTAILDLDGYHKHEVDGGGVVPCMTTPPNGGSCDYTPGNECGCPANQKCTIDDLNTGHTKCITYGASLPWSKCNGDSDCGKGSWCDIWSYKTCRPICSDVGQCPSGTQCLPTSSDSYNFIAIPGLKVCTPHCEPETTAPCAAGVTCIYDGHDKDLVCATSGNLTLGAMCNFQPDCAKGLVCVGTTPHTCEQWCHPANGMSNASCPASKKNCVGAITWVNRDNILYGICSP